MSDPAVYYSNLQRGQLLREREHYQEACNFLGDAIQADPEQPQAYLELALAQSQIPARKSEALGTVDRAVALSPNSAHFLGYKAYLQSHLGLNKEALHVASRALEIDPCCPIALLAQANAYTQLAEWDQAGFTALRMLELDAEDIAALNLRAQALRFQGRHRESRDVIAQILARVPNDAFGQANAGYEALKVGDHRRANEHFLNALRADPHYDYARRGLLQSLRSRVWIYRFNLRMLMLFAEGRESAVGLRVLIFVLTIATGGLFMGLLLLYLVLAVTLQPISNFFLLLEPVGRHALTFSERGWALLTGAIACILLLTFALTSLVGLLAIAGGYLLLFAFCVYVPQWADAWRARKERRLLVAENPS
jgi:tetratricopeptide (TPR) repeat protein